MQGSETASEEQANRGGHKLRFTSAKDARKRKVQGLWQRGERYYAPEHLSWAPRTSERKKARLFRPDRQHALTRGERSWRLFAVVLGRFCVFPQCWVGIQPISGYRIAVKREEPNAHL